MRNTSCPSIHDADVVAAWREQIAVAVKTPNVLPHCMRDCEEVLPRFAAYYTYLKALPRRARKALQRHWRLSLGGIALMLALGQSPGLAATIPVGGNCTLVDAITAANTDSATGGCPAGSGADTIVLPAASTQTLNQVNNSTYGATGLPVISSAITIEGQGSTVRRDSAAPEFRIVAVSNTGELTLHEATITAGRVSGFNNNNGGGVVNYGGMLTLNKGIISGNYSYNRGGGVANYYGTLTVTNSTISGNSAYVGGGMHGHYSTLTVTGSKVSGNSAAGSGGVYSTAGTLTVMNSTIANNFGALDTGGVLNGGTCIIMNGTISGNSAGNVTGGVKNVGTCSIMNSTISGNSADYGGGIVNDQGTCTVFNSTISSNSATMIGGVHNNFGTLAFFNSTIVGNTAVDSVYGNSPGGVKNRAGALILVHTLVTGNAGLTGPEVFHDIDYGGTVLADNQNLFGVNGNAGVVGFIPGSSDIVPPAGIQLTNILNPVLAFNGGPTETHALVPGSPAIDAGGPVCSDATGNPLIDDQRGKPRIVDGNGDGTAACDIGAFEFFPVANNLVTLDPGLDTSFDPTPVLGAPAGTFTIGATFTNTSGTPLRFPFFTVTELSDANLLLNAEEGAHGVGATVTPNVGDQVLSPGETVQVDFVIGLQTPTPFTFFVDLFAEPLGSAASTSRQRPNATTKTGRR